MPVFAALFLGVFKPLFLFLAAMLGRKLAIVTAYVAASTAAITGSAVILRVAAEAAIVNMPDGFAMGAWLFVPDNAGACIGVCLLADFTVATMHWWRSNLAVGAQVAGS